MRKVRRGNAWRTHAPKASPSRADPWSFSVQLFLNSWSKLAIVRSMGTGIKNGKFATSLSDFTSKKLLLAN
jgi:hypothetical protein